MAELLRVENLIIEHARTGLRLVDDLSFTLKTNRTLAIVGESGGGKSTLAKALLGFIPEGFEIRGKIIFQQKPCQNFTALRGKQIGLLLQNAMNAFDPLMNIEKQWHETLCWHHIAKGSAARDLMINNLAKMGLSPPERYLSCYPNQLSGGQLQRIMLAFTLSLQPKLIIADEPTSALDQQTQQQLLPLFQQIATEDRSLIFITHDMTLAAQLSDEIMVLKDGKIIEHQTTSALFHSPQQTYTRQLLESAQRLEMTSQKWQREK